MAFESLEGVVNPNKEALEKKAQTSAIMEQIEHLDLDELNEVTDHIEKAIRENPSIKSDPDAQEKIRKVHERLGELLKSPDVLH